MFFTGLNLIMRHQKKIIFIPEEIVKYWLESALPNN